MLRIIWKCVQHSIEELYNVNGLMYNLPSASHIYYKGNEVKYLSNKCVVTNLILYDMILTVKRVKNMYIA